MARISRLLPVMLATMALCGGAAWGQQGEAKTPDYHPVFDIPFLSRIMVDGHQDDWQNNGFPVNSLAPVNGGLQDARDQDARFRMGWNEQGLLILVMVQDNTPTEGEDKNALWQKDSLEIFVGAQRWVRDWLQIIVGPGVDPKTPEIRYSFDDHRKRNLRASAPSITVARVKTTNGYTLEALVPWSNLAVTPTRGREIAFQMVVNDVDGDSERSQLM